MVNILLLLIYFWTTVQFSDSFKAKCDDPGKIMDDYINCQKLIKNYVPYILETCQHSSA
jgi:hypothetical protein